MTTSAASSPLAARRVLITRERPGRLAVLLAERGALPVHVPLIATVDPPDGGASLRSALDDLGTFEWLVVTSPAGARRVGPAARLHTDVRLAAVGGATAAVLADLAERAADLVPQRQLASQLAVELVGEAGLPPARILVAQADRANPQLVEALLEAGHDVAAFAAYSTRLVVPDIEQMQGSDALVLASGSAAESLADAVATHGTAILPDVVVAIGPTTAEKAREVGLKVCGVAADHSLEGLVDELERHFPGSEKL